MEAEICALAPSDWQIRSVEDVCKRVTSGGTPSRTRPDFYVDGSWPWVKTQELQDTWIDHTEEKITDEAVANSSAKVLPPNTILLAMYGATVGQLGILRSPMTCNQACCAMIVDSDKADFRYLYHHLRYSRTQLKSLATGAAQQNLSGALIKSLLYPFPPLAEQKAIASVLGALDDKIELNRRMNATLEAMARALFHSWFVDFDPVRAKLDGRKPIGLDETTAALFPDSFQESSLGHVPKGWAVKPLSELCQLGRGASPRPINDFMNGEVPWVKIADATAAGGPFLFATKEKVKKAGAEKSVAVAPGDLILSNSATCGVPMFVELHGCIHDGWLYFKNLRSISKLYLFHVLIELAEHLVHIADGSVQKNLNTNLVGQQVVLVPPKEIVDAFDSQATVWFAKMRQNGLESRTLAILRDTLLTKLLSGELQVADVASKTATHL